MKILLDSCVWGGSKKTLIDAGHEVDWVGDWNHDPGDAEILKHAFEHQFVLVTLECLTKFHSESAREAPSV